MKKSKVYLGVVMLVRCSSLVTKIMKKILEDGDYWVEVVNNDAEFIKKLSYFKENKVDIHCFIINSFLRGIDAYQTLRWLKTKEYLRGVSTVLMGDPTFFTEDGNKKRAIREGANDYLIQPSGTENASVILAKIYHYVEMSKVFVELFLNQKDLVQVSEELFKVKRNLLLANKIIQNKNGVEEILSSVIAVLNDKETKDFKKIKTLETLLLKKEENKYF